MNIFSLFGACVLTVCSGVSGINKKASYYQKDGQQYYLDLDSSTGLKTFTYHSKQGDFAPNADRLTYSINCWGTSGFNSISTFGSTNDLTGDVQRWFANNLTTSNYYFGVFEVGSYYNYYEFVFRFYFINPTLFVNSTYYLDDKVWRQYIEDYNSDNTLSNVYGRWYSFFPLDLNLNGNVGTVSYTTSGYTQFVLYNNVRYDGRLLAYRDGSAYLAGVEPQRHYGSTYSTIDYAGTGDGQNLSSIYSFLPYYYFYSYDTRPDLSHLYDFNIHIEGAQSDWNSAYTNGFNDGFESGNSEGQATGYADGFHDGELRGYDEGYTAGVNSPTYSFASLFGSIADTPVLIIRKLFDFDLFGVSALTVILSCFTALIVLYIFRKLV